MAQTRDSNGIYTSELIQNISYPDSGNNACFGIEKNSFWFNHRNNVINDIMQKFPHDGNFADIGGGNGYQADFIRRKYPQKKVFLIEPGYSGCLNARKYGVEDVYNIPFQEFDFQQKNIGSIGLFDVIEHIEDDAGFLREISNHCQKGTFIFITVPAHKWLWSDTDDYAGHYRRYNSDMIKKLANNAGTQLLYNGYFMFYIPLPAFFIRALPYKIRGARDDKKIVSDDNSNHVPNPIIGSVLKLMSNMETGIIRNFGKMPFGGSCIAVFRTN